MTNLEKLKQRDLAKIDPADERAKANIERYYTDAPYRKRQERIRKRIMGDIEELLGVHLTEWRAEIRVDKKTRGLGTFADEIEAAKAYDVATKKYHGEFAKLNFPD